MNITYKMIDNGYGVRKSRLSSTGVLIEAEAYGRDIYGYAYYIGDKGFATLKEAKAYVEEKAVKAEEARKYAESLREAVEEIKKLQAEDKVEEVAEEKVEEKVDEIVVDLKATKIIAVAEAYLADPKYSPMFATDEQVEMVTERLNLKSYSKLEETSIVWNMIWDTLTEYSEAVEHDRWYSITDARSAMLEIVNVRAREIKKELGIY